MVITVKSVGGLVGALVDGSVDESEFKYRHFVLVQCAHKELIKVQSTVGVLRLGVQCKYLPLVIYYYADRNMSFICSDYIKQSQGVEIPTPHKYIHPS